MTYEQYIASSAWQQKRQQRIEFDNHMCAICHSTEHYLSVHHLHYETLGNEDITIDLITACSRCHRHLDTIERYNRYSKRKRKTDLISIQVQERYGAYGVENRNIQVDVSLPLAYAQPRDGRSVGEVVKVDESDFIKKSKNRC